MSPLRPSRSRPWSFARECRVFEVCNPHQAKKVLEANLEISTALPGRISVYEEGEATKLATIKPTAMIELYCHAGAAGGGEGGGGDAGGDYGRGGGLSVQDIAVEERLRRLWGTGADCIIGS